MTTSFTSLITSEHINAPKFVNTVAGICQPLLGNLSLLDTVPSLYSVSTAIGAQLDVIGQWVGITRNVAKDDNFYFSFDVDDLGFDHGIWWSIGDPLTETIALPDDVYRQVIQAKILCNTWDGSLPVMVAILKVLFGSDTTFSFVESTLAITINVNGGTYPAILQFVVTDGYLSLSPVGVSVTWNFNR